MTSEEIAAELGTTVDQVTIYRLPNGAVGRDLDEVRKEVARNMANPRYAARSAQGERLISRDEYHALRRDRAIDETPWAD